LGKALEKFILINRHRVAKSAPPLRQLNYAMHMLGQHHPAVYVKGIPNSHRRDDRSQQLNVTRQKIVVVAFQQVDGEKVSAATMPRTSVIGHGHSIAALSMRRNALRLLRPTRAAQFVLLAWS
jgi:hypothetical protein